jgi:hypothetical protein
MKQIEDLDFHYHGVEVTYMRCSCSCGKISEVEVSEVDLNQIMWAVCNYLELNTELDRYCVDRMIRKANLYNKYDWDWEISNDYYGDCIEKVVPAYNTFYTYINSYMKYESEEDKILCLLSLEYDYILDKIRNKKWSIIDINLDDIIIPNKEHMSSIESESWYEENELPICVCIKKGNKFELIDGYHRLKSLKNKDKIRTVVGE